MDFKDLPPELQGNPFFDFSEETNFVPAWDRIRPEHCLPALHYAMEQTRRNVEAIKNNKRKPTFRNTVEDFERAFELLEYFVGTIYNMMPENDAEETQYEKTNDAVYKALTLFLHDIFADSELFQRFEAVRAQPGFKKLSGPKKWLTEAYCNGFTDGGAKSKPAIKEELGKIRERMADLTTKIHRNMKRAGQRGGIFVGNEDDLAGVSPFLKEAAARKAAQAGHEGQWLFTAETGFYAAFITSCENRDLRKKMWLAYHSRGASGPFNNAKLILELNALQQEEAHKLGYRNMAAMVLQYETARTAATVGNFLREIKRTAKPVAQEEITKLASYANKMDGLETLEPWDIAYYTDKMKKEILGFGDEELRPYFELENVLTGTFGHFEKLFGLHFEETDQYPVYHPDVRAYNVTNARTGKPMGVIFLDLLERSGKPAGIAWSSSVLSQGLFMGRVQRAIDVVVCKYPRGQDGKPTLLTHDDVLTLFHELGHASHNLLSKARYRTLGGTNVVTDFVEFPSQIQENWAWEPEVLKTFAVHYETGEPIAGELLEKLKTSRKLMAGYSMLERARRGRLDLSWAQSDPKTISCARDFEKAVTANYKILPDHGTYMSTHFSHRFGGGYDSAFYSYQWCQAMDAQAFALFERDGLYNRAHAMRLRHVYEAGGSREAKKLFREFTQGRSVTLSKLFKRDGLLSERFDYEAANDNEWQWQENSDTPDQADLETPVHARKPEP